MGASRFIIKRMSGKIEVTIHTARPGLVIGKKGLRSKLSSKNLKKLTGKEIWVEVEEIKRPDLDAKLVAEGIAKQIERQNSFSSRFEESCCKRRWMPEQQELKCKSQVEWVVPRLLVQSGIKREEFLSIQCVLNIDYATARAETTYGSIGVKVWINKGEENSRSK